MVELNRDETDIDFVGQVQNNLQHFFFFFFFPATDPLGLNFSDDFPPTIKVGLKNLTKERTDFDKKARTCVCHDKTRRLSRQKHARRDETFVATYIC